MKVYVVSGSTESGDDYLYVWQNKPTREEILKTLQEDWVYEFGGYDLDDETLVNPDEDTWTMNAPDEADEVETVD